eukprot:jgi/Tetstr1/433884/TSEL_023064.t1
MAAAGGGWSTLGQLLGKVVCQARQEARAMERSSQKVLEIIFKGPLKGPIATDAQKHKEAREAVERATDAFRRNAS